MATIRHSPSHGAGSPDVWGVHDPATGSIQYVVADPASRRAALVDVVLDYRPSNARTSTENVEIVLDLVTGHGLTVDRVIDTHPHADHLMASALLKERTGAPTAIGAGVVDIAHLWASLYNLPDTFDPSRHFDGLLSEGDRFAIGDLVAEVWHTPGHTLASLTLVVGDAAFVADTLMQPDAGTSRCDFPGGSSSDLWASLQRILSLPEDTRLFVGHDYAPGGREPEWEATVAEQRAGNVHVGGDATESAFRALRDSRDLSLPLPDRMLAALQINLRGGRDPTPENDGHSYLKIPLNRF